MRPGMEVGVIVKTGSRTLLTYLLHPFNEESSFFYEGRISFDQFSKYLASLIFIFGVKTRFADVDLLILY